MTAPEAKLAIIRKLLAKAEDDAASPAESEAFMAKAAELMARYGVDRAMLADGDEFADALADRRIVLEAPYALDKFGLLNSVGLALGLRVVQSTRRAARGKEVAALLFGFDSDIQRTEILFTSLLVQASRGLAAAEVPSWENKAAYKRAWLAGFTATIYGRLLDAEQYARNAAGAETTASGRSGALVLADRSRIVASRFAEAFPGLQTIRPRVLSGSGQHEGEAAGRRADLGGPAVAGRRRHALDGQR
jgi:hypothetical protein